MYIMATLVGCGVLIGIAYYKRSQIIRGFLTKYSDYKEEQKKIHEKEMETIYKETPKEKLISCKYYDFEPNSFIYERTIDKHVTSSKLCKLKFKNFIFYSFLKNYNLRDTYLEYIDNLDKDSNNDNNSEINITHLNKITNCKPQLLSATATIKIKSCSTDLIPEFDILELVNKFSFNGNTLYLTDINKAYMLCLLNEELNLKLELDKFFIDGDTKNFDADNLDIEILYQLITNDADIYNGTNLVLNFDEYNSLKVATKFKEL